jgi:hypothetical protein
MKNILFAAVAALAVTAGVDAWLGTAALLPLLYILPCAAMMAMCLRGQGSSDAPNTTPDSGGGASDTGPSQWPSVPQAPLASSLKKGNLMATKHTSTAAAAAFLATALVATVAFAQGNQTPTPQAPTPREAPMSGQGMMGKGGMMDMAQMNRMMENCSRMMESKQHSPSGQPSVKPNNG